MAAMATGFNSDRQQDKNCKVQEMNATSYKSGLKKTSRNAIFLLFLMRFKKICVLKLFLYSLRMTQLTLILDFCLTAQNRRENVY